MGRNGPLRHSAVPRPIRHTSAHFWCSPRVWWFQTIFRARQLFRDVAPSDKPSDKADAVRQAASPLALVARIAPAATRKFVTNPTFTTPPTIPEKNSCVRTIVIHGDTRAPAKRMELCCARAWSSRTSAADGDMDDKSTTHVATAPPRVSPLAANSLFGCASCSAQETPHGRACRARSRGIGLRRPTPTSPSACSGGNGPATRTRGRLAARSVDVVSAMNDAAAHRRQCARASPRRSLRAQALATRPIRTACGVRE